MIIIAAFSLSCTEKDTIINAKELPTNAQTFISTNWPDATVNTAIKDRDGAIIEYNVILSDATKIEFDKKGNWESVDNNNGIPTGFILSPIVTYVTTNFANDSITEISKDDFGYDVELSNHIDLEFDKKGNFKRID